VSGVARADVIRWMVGRDVAEEFPRRDNVRIGDVVLEARDLAAPPRVKHLNLAVRRGEIVALAGLVGAGRTSAALALVGATRSHQRARGQILLHGAPVRFRSPAEALQHGVAYVTEDRKHHGIFPILSVRANISVSRLSLLTRFGWLSPRRETQATERPARECRVRAANLTQAIATLSGGNQQKALLARYLLVPPKVLILDEPTRGVDVAARADIYALIDRLSREGLAIVLISSDLTEVLGMADRVLVMKHGHVAGEIPRAAATPGRIMELATFAS
jgi:ABC-type sugar transport system ATPase subunit